MLQLKKQFYWPGQWNDVKVWCRRCPTCATWKTAPQMSRAPLQPVEASYPLQIVAMDILGSLPGSDAGNSYILVVGDYFTQWDGGISHPQPKSNYCGKEVDK